MLSLLGRTAVRSYLYSSRAINYRVESASLLCLRVSAAIIGPSVTHNSSCMSLPRNYATNPVSRPKAHTGRTTRSPRKAKSTTKSKSTEGSSDDITLEKTEPKIKPKINFKSRSKAKKKLKVKTKPKAKAKARPKKTPVAKKPQTEEEKAAAAEKAKRMKIRTLKEVALSPPTRAGNSAWKVLLAEQLRGQSRKLSPDGMKELSRKYQNLTPEEREHYNHVVNQNRIQSDKEYRDWIESQSVNDIYKANLARIQLKRMGISQPTKLDDARSIKKPRRPFIYFYKERWRSGDFKGIKVFEGAKLAGREFKELSQEERQKYDDLYVKDKERYYREKAAEAA